MIAGSYKGDRPINLAGVDKVQLKCDCINGSIAKGIQGPILYSLALSSFPAHKRNTEPKIKFFERKNGPVLSHTTFYLEDDGRK